jgi:hypothetical protein
VLPDPGCVAQHLATFEPEPELHCHSIPIDAMAALCVAVGLALAARPAPIVGAIRWDAYFSQPGMPEFEDPNFGAWSLDKQTHCMRPHSITRSLHHMQHVEVTALE